MQKQSTLVTIIKFLIYAAAFVPLIIFSDYMSPFHFGKVVVFRSLVEIMAVFYLVLILKDHAYRPRPTRLFWAVTIFTLAFGLTTLTSVSIYQSFWGTLERMGGWFSFIHFWAFFVIAGSIFRTNADWLKMLNLSLVVGLLSAFYGFLQKTKLAWVLGSGGRTKIFGTIGNPALFAGYMIFSAFLALMMMARPQATKSEKRFYFSVFLIDAFSVLLAGVRGSVLALVVGIVMFGILYAKYFGSKKAKRWTIVFLIMVIVSAGILYSLRNSDFVKQNQYLARYSDISPTTYTVNTRLWAWGAGFDGLNDSFKSLALGWGPENFNIPFSKHFNPNFYRGLGSETLFDRAHNQFIEVLVTMGLVGFASYLAIYFFTFRILNSLRSVNAGEQKEILALRIGLTTTLVAYIIHNSFIFDTSANYLLFFVILGFVNYLGLNKIPNPRGQLAAQNHGPKPNPGLRGQGSMAVAVVGIILMVAAVLLIYFTDIVPARANYTTTRAIVESWNNRHDAAVEKFKEAMAFDTFGKYEIRHRYGQYILEYANKRKIDSEIEGRLLLSVDNIKKNLVEFPNDYLPYLYIARAYVLLGKTDRQSPYNDLALEYALKAKEISPTFIRTYYEIAQSYLNKKDYQRAAESFKKAVELNPKVGISWWYLGITQVEGGDKAEGLKSLNQAFEVGYDYKGSEEDLLRLVSISVALNDYQGLASFYKELIRIKPTNPQYHASLAAIYAKLGFVDEAVKEARVAAQLDPGFEAEARAFVKSLDRQW